MLLAILTLPDNCRRPLNRTWACPTLITSNLRHIQTSPESYIFHPRCNFLLYYFIFTTHAPGGRVSPSVGSLPVPRSTSLHHHSSARAPTRTARRLFDLSLFPIPLPSLHLNPCRNRHATVTLGRTSRILAAIMSTLPCHRALINSVQG